MQSLVDGPTWINFYGCVERDVITQRAEVIGFNVTDASKPTVLSKGVRNAPAVFTKFYIENVPLDFGREFS